MHGGRLWLVATIALAACICGGYADKTDFLETDFDFQDTDTYSTEVENAIRAVLERLRLNPAIYPSLDFLGRTRQIIQGNTDLTVSFSNAEIIGIPDFVTENVTHVGDPSNMIYLTLSFDELVISGENYGIFGLLAGVLIMNADGPFEMRFGKANLDANARYRLVSAVPLVIVLEDLIADATIQSFSMEMVNMFGTQSLTDEFNLMMSTVGIDIIHLYKEQIDIRLGRYLENLLNGLLSRGKSLNDLNQHEPTEIFDDLATGAVEIMQEIVKEFASKL